MDNKAVIELMADRQGEIREWLQEWAPYTAVAQKHLDSNTPEQAYWHHGYQAALRDVLKLLDSSDHPPGNTGIPN